MKNEVGQTDVEGPRVCVRVLYGEQVQHLLDNFTALRHPPISPWGSLPKVKKISRILMSTKHSDTCTHALSLIHTLQSFLPRNTFCTCETHNPRVHIHTAMRLSSNFSTFFLLRWNVCLTNKDLKNTMTMRVMPAKPTDSTRYVKNFKQHFPDHTVSASRCQWLKFYRCEIVVNAI